MTTRGLSVPSTFRFNTAAPRANEAQIYLRVIKSYVYTHVTINLIIGAKNNRQIFYFDAEAQSRVKKIY